MNQDRRRSSGPADNNRRGQGRPDGRRGQSSDRRGGPPSSDRPDRPARRGPGSSSPDRPDRSDRSDRRSSPTDRSGRPDRSGRSDQRGGTGRSRDWVRPADQQGPRSKDQQEYDGPDLPEDITTDELDRSVTAQLKGLPEKLAARVAKHLAAAQMYLDEDPELAYRHARAARARAPRLAVVREAAGETAYRAGHYAEALADLRAAKRMNGATAYLPIMADCHRALGHPDQAIKLSQSPSVAGFPPAAKAEMTIVVAGARRDQGQVDAALRALEQAPLNAKTREHWVVRLRYAYADALVAAGRDSDALEWFNRTAAIDADKVTDAEVRVQELEGTAGA